MRRVWPHSASKLSSFGAAAVLVCSILGVAIPAQAQTKDRDEHGPEGIVHVDPPGPRLNENCTVSIMNRSVQPGADGSFLLPNVPVDEGLYRVRAVCRQPDATTIGGQSAFFSLTPANIPANVHIVFGQIDPIPVSLRIQSPPTAISVRGQTLQLSVIGTLPDGTTKDLTSRSLGTTYATSNPNIATVSTDGLVTAASRGQVIISARNEGVLASATFSILIPNDTDGDGMTDEYERANGLNPNDPNDAAQDPDNDGLTNLQEFLLGTNPRSADTDGDGLSDGAEVRLGTDPLRADTDGDGLSDGQEVSLGTNPLLADTDGDGLPDGLETQLGLNPKVADATTAVRGRVVDQNGTPVSGASAIVFNLLTASTDSTGVFNIPVVPAGLGPITVLARFVRTDIVNGVPTPILLDGTSNPVPAAAGATTDAGTIQIGVNSGTVTGAITDPQSRAVAGAQVSLTASNGDVRTAMSDATGRYRFTNVSAGALTLTATDPRSGLRGRTTSTLPLNQAATVNVQLGPSASIAGTVFGRDDATPVAGATVRLSGSIFAATTADPVGRYTFDFVPLGPVTIEASDASGNRGRTAGALTTTGQRLVADVAFLGRGSVAGVVRDGAGNPAANTTVDLNSNSIFGGSQRATTDGTGGYAFNGVFLGPFGITARSAVTNTGGQASGAIDSDAQAVTANITLGATATLAGNVFRANTTTAAPGTQVRLSNGLSTLADSNGHYQFTTLPLGGYTVDVTDPTTGDRGRNSGTLTTQDQTLTVNVTLNGLGRVVVTVRDGANALVEATQVTLFGQTTFGGSFSGQTAADGTLAFDRVLAGNFSVSGSAVLGGITTVGGSSSGNVALNATSNVTVRLQSVGSLLGTIFGPEGTTPFSNVTLDLSGPVGRHLVNPPSGSYRFDLLPTGTYSLDVRDAAGNLRARATNISISSQGQESRRDVTVIGVGAVAGQLTFPDGSGAAGILVQGQTSAAGLGRALAAVTDVNGNFAFSNVVIGPFSLSASTRSATQTFFGTTSGQVSADGDQITANIRFSANLIPTITTFYDVNNFFFNQRENGSIQDGVRSVFAGDSAANRGGILLDIVANGTPNRFTGQGFGTAELGGRQIAIQQSNLAGLNVTRRLFIPQTGYFARALEELSNPTAAPITVDVRLTSHFRFISKVQNGFTFNREPRVVSTSSGDNLLDVSDPSQRDHWAIVDDDQDNDPFQNNDLPPVALVFDGVGNALPVTSAQFTDDFVNNFGRATVEWRSVTVAPGQTVGLMHFVSQQFSRAGAQASAQRLVQLPPEALAGLTDAQRASIQNFALPPAGTDTLAPLPPLAGTSIAGRALGGDGTSVPAVQLTFKSTNPIFGGSILFSADSAGNFQLNSRLSEGNSLPVPADGFTLQALDTRDGVRSDVASGSFAAGLLTATQDVTFSGTGSISGIVRRANGVVVSGGTVQLSGGALPSPLFVSIAANGTFSFGNLPAGTMTLAVTIPHPQGSPLTAATTTVVRAGQVSPANLAIAPTGSLTGLVRRSGGQQATSLAVQLHGAAGFTRSATTDTGGRFTFTDVLAGPVTIETFDSTTSTAATAQPTIVADQTVTQDLNLSQGGIVTGIVTRGTQVVSGAQVTVTASNGSFSGVTGSNGSYSFTVNPGGVSVVVTDPASGLHGSSSGTLGLAGQTLRLDIGLFAGGTVTGTVFRFGGAVPAPGVQVSINRVAPGLPSTTMTNGSGVYRFDLVPLGSFILNVTNLANGDRGSTSNQINANNETRVVNVTLVGLGAIAATVQDASGRAIGNAQLSLYGQTQFGGFQQGTTQSDGTLTFANVLAGGVFVQATDPGTGLQGTATSTAVPGATTPILVRLQAAGSIVGRVLNPQGQPVPNVIVRAFGPIFRQTTTAGDGSFAFNGMPLGGYTLDTLDDSGRVRDRQSGLTLAQNDDLLSRDLRQMGIGTVSGTVRSNGTVAAGVSVSVRSLNAVVGGFFNATTGTDGVYTVTGVPVGPVVATASSPASQLLGESSGQITQDGQQITVDIDLLNNAVNLPLVLYDANNFYYNEEPNGSIADGTNSVFGGDFSSNRGASLLDIVSNGTPIRFTGGTIGTQEDGGREIAVRQQNLAGLDVTLKLFIPADGYFARMLEVVSNPTPNPITVDVRVRDNFRAYNSSQVIRRTSSGDTLLSTADAANPDRWVVVDDSVDGDPFVVGSTPAVGIVFDGPGGADRATATGSFVSDCCSASQLTYQWSTVTIQPGQQVAFLHLYTQQTSRAAAQASADRLMNLPPEALAGLSAAEAGEIRNFAVPAGGVSQLAPLPALNGSVSGTVFASDNATVLPFAQVRFKSNNLFFGHTVSRQADQNGAFLITGSVPGNGNSSPVPIDQFTLQAFHPNTGVQGPDTLGGFGAGQTAAVANIVFSNTGIVTGAVRRPSGALLTTGSVSAQRTTSPFFSGSSQIAGTGGFTITGLPAGTYNLTASVGVSQCCSSLSGTRSTTITNGQVTAADVTVQPTGTVTGTVRNGAGTPAPNVTVRATGAGILRQAATNANGQFTLFDVAVGPNTLQAFEPNTNIVASASITVAADQTATQDLMLIALGSVQVQVNFADGSPAPSAQVDIRETAQGNFFSFVGYTDSTGRLTVANVPVGAFAVRGHHPNNSQVYLEVAGTIANNGDVVPALITLPRTDVLTGRVSFPDGSAAANAFVNVFDPQVFWGQARTDANGNYSLAQMPFGRPLTVRAFNPNDTTFFRDVITDGTTLAVNVTLPALATLRVTVLQADGTTPFANVRINLRDAFTSFFRFVGSTDSAGVLNVTNVPEGMFAVQGFGPSSTNAGSAGGTILPADHGHVVNVTINAPLSGNVQGVVTAGDGQTPISSAFVEALDVDTGNRLTYSYTGSTGSYALNNFVTGGSGFRIVAHSPADFNTTVAATGAFTTSGQTLTINLTLPVGVVTGTVSFTDHTAVEFPNVFATQTINGSTRTFYQNGSFQSGNYTIIGVVAGAFSVTAQDNGSGLTATVGATAGDPAVTTTVNVTLPGSVTLTGRVLTAGGQPVPSTDVTVRGSGLPFDRSTSTDSQGVYTLTHVGLGSLLVQACQFGTSTVCGSATGNAGTDLATIILDLLLPATGSVAGTVFAPGNVVAVANAFVTVQASGNASGGSSASGQTDSGGHFVIDGVAVGDVRATGTDPSNSQLRGFADGTVTAGTTTTIDVVLGNAVQLGVFNLDGTDGFRYDVTCQGALNDGGTVNRRLNDAYDGSYYLSTTNQGQTFPCVNTGRLEVNGRQIVIGPQPFNGLSVTRKVFVPTGGGFARFLEVLTNPTNAPVTATFEVRSNLGSDSSTRVVVAPSSTNDTYAVTDQSGVCCDPGLAHVFAGPNAPVPVSAVQFQTNSDNVFYRYTLTIGAGETAVLMHFAVQRGANESGYTADTAAAEVQAQALRDLTDPNALAGMTAADKQQVKNFVIP